ncbi:uncharacterized protein DUF600 [Nocardiopsis sp. Huas11]|uniref:immunity protein YezG family protein n=1 Tax=Nocardiopsis sp. Huas11 TaxID=2183912 RepID=UPI000F248BC6|nr:immunity protein YezG family protein [Nocardiopsis sp. Huas11]RKS05673.1 uncharacterized protein DUF600 [Nocardiopsis sp. Huas11]
MDPQEQSETLRKLGDLILDEVRGPWTEIALKYQGFITLTTSIITVTREDGNTEKVVPPSTVDELMDQIRDEMYEQGKGTWFSAQYTITPPGRFSVDFDYDNQPTFPFEPDPKTYYEDMAHFPRDFENTPDWLKDKIRTALTIMKQEKDLEESEGRSTE